MSSSLSMVLYIRKPKGSCIGMPKKWCKNPFLSSLFLVPACQKTSFNQRKARERRKKKRSGAHSRVATLIQPSFQKKQNQIESTLCSLLLTYKVTAVKCNATNRVAKTKKQTFKPPVCGQSPNGQKKTVHLGMWRAIVKVLPKVAPSLSLSLSLFLSVFFLNLRNATFHRSSKKKKKNA